MSKKVTILNTEVTSFLDTLNLPLRKEIERLREIIMKSANGLTENIKWNGPNYCHDNEDRVTMRIQPKQIQLIFHRGAKKLAQPKKKMIDDKSGLLVWKENDRAIATFKTMTDIENAGRDLECVVNKWIKATS